ncbi:MAG: hypothetical protein LBL04_14095 [Bacteroidales bacterium]|jgi:hypothetical protein|nr:hypothetical protein [Bacteroidales bacterium]
MSIEEVKEAAIRYAQEAYPKILEERGDIDGVIMGASANGFIAGIEFSRRGMRSGNLVNSLMSAQEHMLGQYGITPCRRCEFRRGNPTIIYKPIKMKIIEVKTSMEKPVSGDIVKLKGKYYQVSASDVPHSCRAGGVCCAGYGKPGICKSLPYCFTGIAFIRLSGRAQKKIERKIIINQ